MDQSTAKTSTNKCLPPIDKIGLDTLIAERKADPNLIKTSKCKTVAEGRFRHLNFIRNFSAYVVDEPPGLLGEDTAPNPSEVSLAALGSCLAVGIHANAVARGITVFKLEIELEGDLNVSCVWGTGNLSDKPAGFTEVRAKVTFEADRPREELDALVAHAVAWSPIANTFTRAISLNVNLA
jgi:uncharacterized OsmC-like protein